MSNDTRQERYAKLFRVIGSVFTNNGDKAASIISDIYDITDNIVSEMDTMGYKRSFILNSTELMKTIASFIKSSRHEGTVDVETDVYASYDEATVAAEMLAEEETPAEPEIAFRTKTLKSKPVLEKMKNIFNETIYDITPNPLIVRMNKERIMAVNATDVCIKSAHDTWNDTFISSKRGSVSNESVEDVNKRIESFIDDRPTKVTDETRLIIMKLFEGDNEHRAMITKGDIDNFINAQQGQYIIRKTPEGIEDAYERMLYFILELSPITPVPDYIQKRIDRYIITHNTFFSNTHVFEQRTLKMLSPQPEYERICKTDMYRETIMTLIKHGRDVKTYITLCAIANIPEHVTESIMMSLKRCTKEDNDETSPDNEVVDDLKTKEISEEPSE